MASSNSQLFCRLKKKKKIISLLREIVSFVVWETKPDGKKKKKETEDTPPPQAHENCTVGSHLICDQVCFYINFKQISVQFSL